MHFLPLSGLAIGVLLDPGTFDQVYRRVLPHTRAVMHDKYRPFKRGRLAMVCDYDLCDGEEGCSGDRRLYPHFPVQVPIITKYRLHPRYWDVNWAISRPIPPVYFRFEDDVLQNIIEHYMHGTKVNIHGEEYTILRYASDISEKLKSHIIFRYYGYNDMSGHMLIATYCE